MNVIVWIRKITMQLLGRALVEKRFDTRKRRNWVNSESNGIWWHFGQINSGHRFQQRRIRTVENRLNFTLGRNSSLVERKVNWASYSGNGELRYAFLYGSDRSWVGWAPNVDRGVSILFSPTSNVEEMRFFHHTWSVPDTLQTALLLIKWN